jgi:hypothetical protein
MKRSMLIGLIALTAAAFCAGCGRHVTVEPEMVPSRNARDWTIESAPAPAPSPRGEGATAPSRPSPAAPPADGGPRPPQATDPAQ